MEKNVKSEKRAGICRFLQLSAVLLFGALALPSCGGGTEAETKPAETTLPVTEAVSEAPTETDLRAQIPDNLPEVDMQGYEYRIWHRDRDDFVADVGLGRQEETGDVVEDAVYHRNLSVMERFHCQLISREVGMDQMEKEMIKSVQSGEDAFDLGLAQVILAAPIAMDGLFLDWYEDLPHVDLTRPWYIGNAAEATSVGGHSYIMIGEYDLDVLRFTYCMYWNKQIAADHDLENIYEVVKDGRWTYDYLLKLSNEIYSDLNSDGKKGEEDLLCFSSDPYSAVVTFQYAFDNPLFRTGEGGIPHMTFDTGKANDIVRKLNDLYWVSPGSFTETWGSGGDAWDAQRLLCYASLFRSAGWFRTLDFDFGIIPYPKYDEMQEKYLTMSDGAHGVMTVPVTVQNPEYSSIIVEALNAETYKQVVPAYYDTALKVKYARDDESSQVLDLLMDGRIFDFGYIYNNDLAFTIQHLVSANDANAESKYTAQMKSSVKRFNKVIEKYQELDG